MADTDSGDQHTCLPEVDTSSLQVEKLPPLEICLDIEKSDACSPLLDSDEQTACLAEHVISETQSDGDCLCRPLPSTEALPLPLKKSISVQSFADVDLENCLNNVIASSLPLKKLMSSCELPGAGESYSCLTSASVTPIPVKKFRTPDSDAGTDLLPVCRICQLPGDDEEALFSPCRCSGSLKYVHYLCLLKWIEISSRKSKRPPKCELCCFQYIRHKRFKFRHWHLPRVSSRDKCLHFAFFFNLIVMMGCAVATVLCFLSDKGQINNFPKNKVELTSEEIITLACGVLFFVSFFIAMTVEIKAKHTIYKLFVKFVTQNTEWQIEPYDKSKDIMYTTPARLV